MLDFISVKNWQIYNLRTLSASDLISSKGVYGVHLAKVKEDTVALGKTFSLVWFKCVKMLTHISVTSNFLKRTVAHVLYRAGPILSTAGIFEYLGLLHFLDFKNTTDWQHFKKLALTYVWIWLCPENRTFKNNSWSRWDNI